LLTQQYVCVMCTLWSDNTWVFTRFHSVKNANTQLIWSSAKGYVQYDITYDCSKSTRLPPAQVILQPSLTPKPKSWNFTYLQNIQNFDVISSSLNLLWQGLQVVFQLISSINYGFGVKLGCNMTCAGGSLVDLLQS
jgi:hypothetical protein